MYHYDSLMSPSDAQIAADKRTCCLFAVATGLLGGGGGPRFAGGGGPGLTGACPGAAAGFRANFVGLGAKGLLSGLFSGFLSGLFSCFFTGLFAGLFFPAAVFLEPRNGMKSKIEDS